MHNRRLSSPKTYPIGKKRFTFIVVGSGPHSRNRGIPLLVVLRDMLKLGESRKEVQQALREGHIKVDGILRRDDRFRVGFMDLIEVLPLKKALRVVVTYKGFNIVEVKNNGQKIEKIKNVVNLKGGKYQIQLHSGKNILSSKKMSVGSSVVISLPDLKIGEKIDLERGSQVVILGGKHRGSCGKIQEIHGKSTTLEDGTMTITSYLYPVQKIKEFCGDVYE